jgi:hypothetical protein
MVNHVALVVLYLQSLGLDFYAELPETAPVTSGRIEENGAFLPSSQMPDRLGEYSQEWQVWGSSKTAALDLLNAGLAGVRNLNGVRRDQGVITRSQVVSVQYEPDTEYTTGPTPTARYICFVRLHVTD